MNRKKIEYISLILIIIIVILIPVYLVKERIQKNKNNESQAEIKYVGRETCIKCHATQYQLWKGSHHDKAMDIATDSTVLGNFNNASFTSKNGIYHKFYKKENRFFVFTDGENGEMKEYEIKYTFGFTPLQQYLVEFPNGRLQTLPLTWNSVNKNWYHMADSAYKNEKITHQNWLHWTNQSQNWNGMCADCHSTNLVKGYNAETDTYQTTYSEIDVSCEACHGPASKHLEWANLPEYSRSGFENTGLTVQTSNIDNKAYVDQCAHCHSRRNSFQNYTPSSKSIYNQIIPSLPVEPAYFVDGQILDEDYEYASFAQSKMYMHDVKCNDCHDVHSGKRYFEGNQLCLQCHKANDYDTKAHHFHKSQGESGNAVISESGVKFEVGSGTQCVNCHMHGRFYMGVDYRNDHSFRIPRPDLSTTLETPNACNQCHKDKTPKWAQNNIENWYGKSRHFQYGEAFHLAQKGGMEGFKMLKLIYENPLYPEIVRAAAIEYLGVYYQATAKEMLFQALTDLNPTIRYAAIRNLELDTEASLQHVLVLLSDEVKAIRIECANKLMGTPANQIPENYAKAYKQASGEYLVTLKYNADFPAGKFSLANYYYNEKQYAEAEKFYLAALKQDEQLHVIKINLAYLYNNMGKPEKAELLFKSYLDANPNDGNILFAYGLLLSELKRYEESLQYLLKASKEQTDNARIFYNIANMYDFFNDKKNTETYLKLAITKDSNNPAFYSALLGFYLKNGMTPEVKVLASEMLIKFPEMENREQIEALLK